MRIRLPFILLITLSASAFAPAGLLAQAIDVEVVEENWEPRYSNAIMAIVEDRIITLNEVRREMAPLIPQIRRESPNEEVFRRRIDEVSREILQNMVDRILIIKDFRAQGMIIPQSYLNSLFDERLNRDFEGDRALLQQFLQAENKTMREYRAELEEEVIVSYMQGQMRGSVTEVSPERIRQFYEENKQRFTQEESVHLRMIMLRPDSQMNRDQAEEMAVEIATKLEAGADFTELAKAHSRDTRARTGGDWGWIERSTLQPRLADVAFSLQKGQHSQPIELQGIQYILFVEDRKDAGVQPLSEVREQIEWTITSMLSRQAQQRWLENLRQKYYVRYIL